MRRHSMGRLLWLAFSLPLAAHGGLAAAAAPRPSSAAQAGACAKALTLVDSDRGATARELQALYQAEQFDQLEQDLSCLLRTDKKSQDGHPGSSAVYWFFRLQMPAPGARPSESLRIQKWRQQHPDSLFAEFAQLRLHYAVAWSVRGSAYAGKVQDDRWAQFTQGLLDTESGLLGARPSLKETPIWHALLLATVLDSAQLRAKGDKVFEDAVRRWPAYHDFYEVKLSRLTPKWGGSWAEVDAFVQGWANRLGPAEGASMYARLYLSVLSHGQRASETQLEWPRMKRSLDELVARYPSAVHTNAAASLGCAYNDVEYFKAALQRIKASEIDPHAWVSRTSPAECKDRLGA